MPDQINAQLAPYIERARKVIQYEQRGNHQDRVVKGGLELFAVHWADEVSTVCKNAGLDLSPIHRFTEHLEGYRQQDPMQRAASLRAVLAILNELGSDGNNGQNAVSSVDTKDSRRNHSSVPTNTGASSVPTEAPGGKTARSAARPASTDGKTVSTSSQAAPGSTKTGSAAHRAVQAAQSTPAAPQNSIRLEAGMSAGHTALTLLSADITAVPGVGPSVAAKLHSLGIRTVRDLLFYFPRSIATTASLKKSLNSLLARLLPQLV